LTFALKQGLVDSYQFCGTVTRFSLDCCRQVSVLGSKSFARLIEYRFLTPQSDAPEL